MTGRVASQDFDLNLAPIIDCFVVLIAFVMISSAFASIAILDAGVSAGGASAKSAPASVAVTITLRSDSAVLLKVGDSQKTTELALSELVDGLQGLKKKWPNLRAATLVADNSVPYQSVVNALDLIRKQLPDVLLGGF